jgi:hypothetical protein
MAKPSQLIRQNDKVRKCTFLDEDEFGVELVLIVPEKEKERRCTYYSSFADPGSGAFLTPGSGIKYEEKNPDPESGIRDEHPRSQIQDPGF